MTILLESVTKLLKNGDYIIVYNKDCQHCIEMLRNSYSNYKELFNKLVRYGTNIYFIDFDIIDAKFKKLIIHKDRKFRFPTFLTKTKTGLKKTKQVSINTIIQPDIIEFSY